MNFLRNIFTFDEKNPWIFTSIDFWIFFAFVLLVFAMIYQKKHARNIFLFIASLFFYYKTGGYFFFLLIFSTIVDYFLGLSISKAEKKLNRRFFLTLSIIINLGVLCYFKYAYFFTNLCNNLLGTNVEVINWMAVWSNNILHSHLDIYTIILPVGISFYTFQTMSYTIDVYRKKVKPITNFFDFGFYVTFFPPLIAGPIIRANEFVPQLYRNYQLSTKEFSAAVFLILSGLVKKILISDYISINFIDRVFDNNLLYTGFENLMAMYGYAIQIYCDFSGYTDIAIGVAMLLGFQLPINFNSPYKAVNLTDFWRRWHISLSTWLRDYLYIPLGGNRKGKARMFTSLLITMILGGLWHGANIKFLIWGGLHGIGLCGNKIWFALFKKEKNVKLKSNKIRSIIRIIITFHFVCFTWIFFRANSIGDAQLMLKQIFTHFNIEAIPSIIQAYWIVFALIAFGFITHWTSSNVKNDIKTFFHKIPIFAKVIVIVVVIILICQAKSADFQPFIYFQF